MKPEADRSRISLQPRVEDYTLQLLFSLKQFLRSFSRIDDSMTTRSACKVVEGALDSIVDLESKANPNWRSYIGTPEKVVEIVFAFWNIAKTFRDFNGGDAAAEAVEKVERALFLVLLPHEIDRLKEGVK